MAKKPRTTKRAKRDARKPRDMLELRLHEPATPARVARAAQLFDRLLIALGVENDAGTTLIVENRYLKATLRTRTAHGAGAVGTILDLISSPLRPPKRANPARQALASELAAYAREECRFGPELWKPHEKEPLARLDQTFAATMDALAQEPPLNSHVVKGTTYVFSKVYRVGRLDEGGPLKARINIEGKPKEVTIAEQVDRGVLFDAARMNAVLRLRLQADWVHVAGETPQIRNFVLIGADMAAPKGAGARILALANQHNVITAEDLPTVLSSIDRDREDED